MRRFEFHFFDGKIETGEGRTDAFTSLGYGAGALRALDFYKEIHDTKTS